MKIVEIFRKIMDNCKFSHSHLIETIILKDLTRDWAIIRSTATDVLEEYGIVSTNRKRVPLKGIEAMNVKTVEEISFATYAFRCASFIFYCKDLVEID
jgi:hypothetical protein